VPVHEGVQLEQVESHIKSFDDDDVPF
jgi:hypothetical protein